MVGVRGQQLHCVLEKREEILSVFHMRKLNSQFGCKGTIKKVTQTDVWKNPSLLLFQEHLDLECLEMNQIFPRK